MVVRRIAHLFSALLASYKVTQKVSGRGNFGSLISLLFYRAVQTASHNSAFILFSLLSKLRQLASDRWKLLFLVFFAYNITFGKAFTHCYHPVVLQPFSSISLHLLQCLRLCRAVGDCQGKLQRENCCTIPTCCSQAEMRPYFNPSYSSNLSFLMPDKNTQAFVFLGFAEQGMFLFQVSSNAPMEI